MVLQEIKDAFPLNVPIPMDEIQTRLQNVYKLYGINYKVKKNTTYSGAYPFTFRQPIKHKIAFKSTILYPFIP